MGSFSHLCIVLVYSCHKQRPPPPALLRRTVLTLASRGQSGHAAFLFCGLRRVRQKHREVHRTEMESGMKKGWMSQTFLDNIAEPVLDKESCWLHQLSCRVVCRLRVCHPLFVANRWWDLKKKDVHTQQKKSKRKTKTHCNSRFVPKDIQNTRGCTHTPPQSTRTLTFTDTAPESNFLKHDATKKPQPNRVFPCHVPFFFF